MNRILFICLGNICRSPAAEGVFRGKAAAAGLAVEIDSAGTGGWHAGHAPDARMTAAAKARGVDLSSLRARQVALSDFYEFDLLLTMDDSNFADVMAEAPPNATAKVRRFLEFAAASKVRDVPDPYYGGPDGFEHVLDLIEDASDGLVRHLMDKG
ncbi:MAG: low molecular weight protein-tyrosine-phosphatase [Pseudomonadota bacterium]